MASESDVPAVVISTVVEAGDIVDRACLIVQGMRDEGFGPMLTTMVLLSALECVQLEAPVRAMQVRDAVETALAAWRTPPNADA